MRQEENTVKRPALGTSFATVIHVFISPHENGEQAELAEREGLLAEKVVSEEQLRESINKEAQKEKEIQRLMEDLRALTLKLEKRSDVVGMHSEANSSESSTIMKLHAEVNILREQLNRANALNSLTKGARQESSEVYPSSNTLRSMETTLHETDDLVPYSVKHRRRHSSEGIYAVPRRIGHVSADEFILDEKHHGIIPRAVSVAYDAGDGVHSTQFNGISHNRSYDDVVEEKIRLLQDVSHRDEDILVCHAYRIRILEDERNSLPC